MTNTESLIEAIKAKKMEFCDCQSEDGCLPAQISNAFIEIIRQHDINDTLIKDTKDDVIFGLKEEIRRLREHQSGEITEQKAKITGDISDGYHTFNELYEHRHTLFSALCAVHNSWKSKLHDDGTMFDGWFMAGIETPDGQATYHLPIRLYDAFPAKEIPKAPAWDGHTSNDVITRIRSLAPKREAVNDDLARALTIILPMAKGYAAVHQVGRNQEMIEWAQAILTSVEDGGSK